MLALSEVCRDCKLRRCKFDAPIFHDERLPSCVLQSRSKRQPMASASDDAADREHAFRLTFPKKLAVQLRFANERTRLIANIDKTGSDHRQRKYDRDLVALGDFAARWINYDTACIRLGIRCFLFLIFVGAKGETAGYKKRDRCAE